MIRALFPGDRLYHADQSIGFVWEIVGDRVEVRNYHNPYSDPTIRVMTLAEASVFEIEPNMTYGTARPILGKDATP